MDAFFASVEQRDNPSLRGLPVAVGGTGNRGVVAAASYEARRFGVHSALSSQVAKQRCRDLIFVKPRFDVYKAVSNQIRSIFNEYTDLVEPLSLDEAYLDVTYTKKGKPSATIIAREIKELILAETGLTASAGVSFNKFLAKMASAHQKPDGLFVITPSQAEAFIGNLAIEKFHGIGKVTAQKFKAMGVNNGSDLRQLGRAELIRCFGKAGNYFFDIAHGVDERLVIPGHEPKSISGENTFETNLYLFDELKTLLESIVLKVWHRLAKANVKGRTITLKIKYADFEQVTRSKTIPSIFTSLEMVLDESFKLLKAEEPYKKGIRLLGFSVSNFEIPNTGPVQLVIEF